MEAIRQLALFVCAGAALAGPFLSPRIDRRLEVFFLGLGVVAATVGGAWSEALVIEALLRPLQVAMSVLFGAWLFSFSHEGLCRAVRGVLDLIGPRPAVGAAVLFAGLAAALVTSAIAALLLVELLYALRLKRQSEVPVAVLGCLAAGLGGGLSPMGGPVAAVAMAKLSAPPTSADNAFLGALLGPWAIPAILCLAVAAGGLFAELDSEREKPLEEDPNSLWQILLLTGRLYVFICGLVLLGAGVLPLLEGLLRSAPAGALFWGNAMASFLDGPTLASLELDPEMTSERVRYLLLGLLIADGALVAGNAANLVASHKLRIPSPEWARWGVAAAGLLMLACFISLVLNPA